MSVARKATVTTVAVAGLVVALGLSSRFFGQSDDSGTSLPYASPTSGEIILGASYGVLCTAIVYGLSYILFRRSARASAE